MRRIRIVFGLLAVALLAAAALLVHRAVDDALAEREAQRSALAARVFDEMERALSELLAREESLSFSGWLAPPAADPRFVLARFQLGPGGALRLSRGAPPALAPLLTAWAERRATARGEEPLAAAGSLEEKALANKMDRAEAQAPAPAPPSPKRAKDSLYDALQSLNRGAEPRAQRAQKLEALAPPEVVAAAEAPRDARADAEARLAARERAAASPAAEAPQAQTSERAAASEADAGASNAGVLAQRPAQPAPATPAPAAPAPPAPAPAASAPASVPARPRALVDPLLGSPLDADRLVLARTVVAGDQGLRQGLILDVSALGDWLRQQGLGGAPFDGAALSFDFAGRSSAAVAAGDAVGHRFAEPFEALAANLRLPPIADAGSAGTVLRLSLLLVAAGGIGLFALYRMLAVAMRYAEQRSNFVAAVSHELKTPLTAIRMYGEMLRDDLVPTDEKRAEYYRTITAESERLSRLIDNVLEFARSERGERALALREGALGAEVTTVCEALRPHASESGFALVLRVPGDLPAVRFDRDALAQILVNLVDNGLKYARSATRREIEIGCAVQDGALVLHVRDHGPGVPQRELGRVFELFHRGESELTRATRGTGLGLALVRSLAARMNARTAARNAEGGGFEVTIAFPLAQAAGRGAMGSVQKTGAA